MEMWSCLSLTILLQKYAIHSCLPPELVAEWLVDENYMGRWDF